MDIKEARKVSLELLSRADGVYLSTIDADGYPQTRMLFNLRNQQQFPAFAKIFTGHDDDLLIYLGTNTSSSKYNQIKKNPAACVYYCIPQEFHSLMLAGEIEIVDDVEFKKTLWQDGWEMYYPQGPADPDYTVLKLKPVKAKGWFKNGAFAFNLA